jgi:hypothetical protein
MIPTKIESLSFRQHTTTRPFLWLRSLALAPPPCPCKERPHTHRDAQRVYPVQGPLKKRRISQKVEGVWGVYPARRWPLNDTSTQ